MNKYEKRHRGTVDLANESTFRRAGYYLTGIAALIGGYIALRIVDQQQKKHLKHREMIPPQRGSFPRAIDNRRYPRR